MDMHMWKTFSEALIDLIELCRIDTDFLWNLLLELFMFARFITNICLLVF